MRITEQEFNRVLKALEEIGEIAEGAVPSQSLTACLRRCNQIVAVLTGIRLRAGQEQKKIDVYLGRLYGGRAR